MTEEAADEDGVGTGEDADDASYGGLFGATLYSLRRSESWTYMFYVVFGGLLAVFVILLFVQSLLVLLGDTVSETGGETGGTFTFSRAFVVVVALFVVGPLLAPIISTARRHRHGTAARRTDAIVGALGFSMGFALYVALVISAPPELRDSVEDSPYEAVELLYALPPEAAVGPMAYIALATGVVWWLHRRAGRSD